MLRTVFVRVYGGAEALENPMPAIIEAEMASAVKMRKEFFMMCAFSQKSSHIRLSLDRIYLQKLVHSCRHRSNGFESLAVSLEPKWILQKKRIAATRLPESLHANINSQSPPVHHIHVRVTSLETYSFRPVHVCSRKRKSHDSNRHLILWKWSANIRKSIPPMFSLGIMLGGKCRNAAFARLTARGSCVPTALT